MKTLRVRIKDRHAKWLAARARDVNFVWNYCNELQQTALRREGRFLSRFDFAEYTAGASKAGLELHSQTVQAISDTYVKSRAQAGKSRLAWRKSHGARRNLGLDTSDGAVISDDQCNPQTRPAEAEACTPNPSICGDTPLASRLFNLRTDCGCEPDPENGQYCLKLPF